MVCRPTFMYICSIEMLGSYIVAIIFQRKRFLGAFLVAAASLLAGAAQAAIQVKESGLGNGGYSNKLTVPVYTGNIWSGFQTISVKDTITGSVKSFDAFCVDPYQYSSTSYTTYTIGNLDTAFSSSIVTTIKKLYNYGYAGTLGPAVVNDKNAAAFQLALWETIADSSVNLYGGNVKGYSGAGGTTAGLLTDTQNLLSNASAYSGPNRYHFTLYKSDAKQDFLVATPVPEPETYAMLLAGIGLMGAVVRRRRFGK